MIRKGTSTDIPAIAAINLRGWQAAYKGILNPEFLAQMTLEDLENRAILRFVKGQRCAVYQEADGPVRGYCFYGTRQDAMGEGYPAYDGELHAIYVDPDWVGQGIGKTLFTYAMEDLRQRGMERMLLWVFKENHPSRRFYEGMGGHYLGEKTFEIAGQPIFEVGYGFALV